MSQAKPKDILLMSSNVDECRAAQQAGLRVVKIKLSNEPKVTDLLRIRDLTDVNFVIQYEKEENRSLSCSKQISQNSQIPSREIRRSNSMQKTNSKISRNRSKKGRNKSETKSQK